METKKDIKDNVIKIGFKSLSGSLKVLVVLGWIVTVYVCFVLLMAFVAGYLGLPFE